DRRHPLPERALLRQRLLRLRSSDHLVQLPPERVADEVLHHHLDAEEGLGHGRRLWSAARPPTRAPERAAPARARGRDPAGRLRGANGDAPEAGRLLLADAP